MSTAVIVSVPWPVVSVGHMVYHLLFQDLGIAPTGLCAPPQMVCDGWDPISSAFTFLLLAAADNFFDTPFATCQGSNWWHFSGLETLISFTMCGCLSVESVDTFTPFPSIVGRASLKPLISMVLELETWVQLTSLKSTTF